jgi:hypothetical protein
MSYLDNWPTLLEFVGELNLRHSYNNKCCNVQHRFDEPEIWADRRMHLRSAQRRMLVYSRVEAQQTQHVLVSLNAETGGCT